MCHSLVSCVFWFGAISMTSHVQFSLFTDFFILFTGTVSNNIKSTTDVY